MYYVVWIMTKAHPNRSFVKLQLNDKTFKAVPYHQPGIYCAYLSEPVRFPLLIECPDWIRGFYQNQCTSEHIINVWNQMRSDLDVERVDLPGSTHQLADYAINKQITAIPVIVGLVKK